MSQAFPARRAKASPETLQMASRSALLSRLKDAGLATRKKLVLYNPLGTMVMYLSTRSSLNDGMDSWGNMMPSATPRERIS